MKTIILQMMLLLCGIATLHGQELITIEHSCSFEDEETNREFYYFGVSSEADQIVEQIVDAVSLSKNFVVKSSDCKNALATVSGGTRFILYNTSFLEKFKKDARTKWAAYCVLAHEIGHHLNGHDFETKDSKLRKQMELEADMFAGGVLHKLGATLDEAKAGIELLQNQEGSETHPPARARAEAIANGWKKSDENTLKLISEDDGINISPTRNRKSGFEMVFVDGGTYTMGSPTTEVDCQHSVTVGSFSIGKYEVTQADWRDIMGSDPPELWNTGCDDCPVEEVSWDDIQGFIKKLNAKAGKTYRLPTEEEWEYAARGGKSTKGFYYSGSDSLAEVGWYKSNFENGNSYGVVKSTHPVGTRKANELGIYDMSGNVLEWCSSKWGAYPDCTADACADCRVVRGGSWLTDNYSCRVAYRAKVSSDIITMVIGFRLAQD